MKVDVGVMSVSEELLSIRAHVSAAAESLKKLADLDDDLKAVAGAAPARLVASVPKNIVSPELSDSGFAAAMAKAMDTRDPMTRMYSASLIVKELGKAIADIDKKRIKVEGRASASTSGSSGELSAAKSLSVKMKESKAAAVRKLSYALSVWAEARKKVLSAVVEIDCIMSRTWPDGSVELRTAVLNANAADEIQEIVMSEDIMKRGVRRSVCKGVKI